MINLVVEQFLKHGRNASYHYADDSGKEWGQGDSYKKKALDLYDMNPAYQAEMLEKADFLWSIQSELDSRYVRKLREIAACMSSDIKLRGVWGRAANDAKRAYPDVDPQIIDAMGVAMTVYREKEDADEP